VYLYPALRLRYSALQNGTSNNIPMNSSSNQSDPLKCRVKPQGSTRS
jgi:hypothetical protein